MKIQPQRRGGETAMLLERAQRVMHESRKLLEQRELQLKQLDHLLQTTVDREIRGRKGAAAKIG